MEVYSMDNTQSDWEHCVLSLITLLLCIVLWGDMCTVGAWWGSAGCTESFVMSHTLTLTISTIQYVQKENDEI